MVPGTIWEVGKFVEGMLMNSQKLFAVYLGGYIERCNTELHDVVFAVGNSIEETYPQLFEKWFGNPKRLHIDSWLELDIVDSHRIILSPHQNQNSRKLYFINLGAYVAGQFMEFHENAFFVGESETKVKERAIKALCDGMTKIHKDNLYDVDDFIRVDTVNGLHVHLESTTQESGASPQSGYLALPKKTVEEFLAKPKITI